jgi:Protein of unknown function DUF45
MGSRRGKPPVASLERRAATEQTPELEVRTSTKRRKTATAWWEGDRLVVALPAHVRGDEREQLVAWLVERARRHRPHQGASDEALLQRAGELVERFDLGVTPTSVRFVSNQRRRWGSCTPETGAIRISDRLRSVPGWVLDAVLVHELAHLVHHGHTEAFHALADRHPRQGEATLFLEGYQLGLEHGSPPSEGPGACAEQPEGPRGGRRPPEGGMDRLF